jgi:hypothetical protein
MTDYISILDGTVYKVLDMSNPTIPTVIATCVSQATASAVAAALNAV